MSSSALILVGVISPLSGIIGSLVWPILQRRYQWSSLKILVILVVMASAIPAYGCLGFVTQGKARFGGLTTPEEMFVLAAYFGELGSVDQLGYLPIVELHRFGIWRLSRLCESVLHQVAASGRGSEVVRVIFHNRQGKLDLLLHL